MIIIYFAKDIVFDGATIVHAGPCSMQLTEPEPQPFGPLLLATGQHLPTVQAQNGAFPHWRVPGVALHGRLLTALLEEVLRCLDPILAGGLQRGHHLPIYICESRARIGT